MDTDLHREPWNKGVIVGHKAPLKLKDCVRSARSVMRCT